MPAQKSSSLDPISQPSAQASAKGMEWIDRVAHQQLLALQRRWTRRRALAALGGGAAAAVLVACGGGSNGTGSSPSPTPTATPSGSPSATPAPTPAGSCSVINTETGGPFPADGSNGPNVLANSAAFRTDIRSDIGGSNVQPGAPFQLQITVVDVSNGCAPVAGAAVYLWHVNAAGEYSAYGAQASNTFLRGVQVADSNGRVTFNTIYPGRYAGRAVHMHARIYQDQSLATTLKTTQFAFDSDLNNEVYAQDDNYAASAATRETSNASDGIFRDGVDDQLVAISGDESSGYVGSITAGV